MSMTERHGTFITFEGPDGSGKTRRCGCWPSGCARWAAKWWRRRNPAERDIGLQIRAILLDAENRNLCPIAEMLLYFAARAQNFDERILPAWERGAVVLSDRFTDSTLAYQGGGRGLGRGRRDATPRHRLSWPSARPDHLHRYRCGDRAGARSNAQRRRQRGSDGRTGDRVPPASPRRSIWISAREYPERIKIVDGHGDMEDVAERVWEDGGTSCLNTFYGNAAAVETLAQMIRSERIPQTILLHGPEGIGKATLVRRFAAELLGDREKIEKDDLSLPENAQPDRRTRKVARGQAIGRSAAVRFASGFRDVPARRTAAADLHPADPAVEGARAIRPSPRQARRVFLIDHLDRANEQAANSLLKILEEPPPYLLILMTAENAYDLLPTIRSRSLIIPMSPLSAERDGALRPAIGG